MFHHAQKSGKLFLVLTLIFSLLIVSVPRKAYADSPDEYDAMREKWLNYLVGSGYSTADLDVAQKIATIDATALENWCSLNKDANRTYLWPDLNFGSTSNSVTKSSYISLTYSRLRDMALAFSTYESDLYQNTGLIADLISALDWMYTNKYNQTKAENGNWFDWEIGVPTTLVNITVMLYDQLTAGQIDNYMDAVEHFSPDPTKENNNHGPSTGANRSAKARIVMIRGIIVKDGAKIAAARDALDILFKFVTSGDGFYRDGSFIQHGKFAYAGGYGIGYLTDMSQLLYLLDGSSWDVTNPNADNVYQWIYQAFEPLIYNGGIMDIVRGRDISRRTSQDHRMTHSAIAGIILLAELAPAADAANFKSMVKYWIETETVGSVYQNIPLFHIPLAKQIINDPEIVSRGELVKNKLYPSMDRAVHLRPGFGFGISMSSNRIYNYESINSENLKGWYTGDGMTYLYNSDQAQFGDEFWALIDKYRLPGTTVDRQQRSNASGQKHASNKNWVGGANVADLYGVAGMELAAWSSTLTARKSWFMFDNEIVALGAGITSTDNRTIETTIDNRKINASGTNQLTVNGVEKPTTLGWSETMQATDWVHLAGNVSGSDIGYYFPDPVTVKALRESRTGAWSSMNTYAKFLDTTSLTRNFLTMWLDHGTNPTNAGYSYALLPGLSSTQTAAYAANPDIDVLENSSTVQAVQDHELHAVAANFWQNSSATVSIDGAPYLTSNKKASAIVMESDDHLEIGISDPTQANTGTIELEIGKPASGIIALDPQVTVTQLSPTIKMSVNVKGMRGGTIKAKFDMTPVVDDPETQTVIAVADAYVRGGTSANTNFGTESGLHIKTATEAYTRYSYIKFDLSHVSIPVGSAKVRLVPAIVGDPGITNTAALVNDDTWSETALTWNNRPANGTALASWTGMTVGTPVEFDVTAQVNAALTGDKTVSMVVYSPSDTGDLGFVSYGSREDAVAGNRPSLVIEPPEPIVLAPSDDAYVRGGADANTNFGSAADLAIKNDTAAYTRLSYLRFDLAGLNAPITKAELRLVPNIVGSSSNTNTAALVNDSTWSEATLTWNNRPTIGTDLASWTNIVSHNPVLIDVTAQVNAALAGGRKLSVAIYSPTNIGGQGFVSYFSSEDINTDNRPSLVVTP